MTFRRAMLVFSGAFLASFGVLFLVAPTLMSSGLGLTIASNTGLVEIRAVFGGLHIALGLFLVSTLRYPHQILTGIHLSIFVALGLFAGHMLGVYYDHSSSPLLWLLIVIESIWLALLFNARYLHQL